MGLQRVGGDLGAEQQEWTKSVMALKVNPGRQSPEKGLSFIFQAIGNVLLQRCRVSMTKHWQHSTKVRDKGIDLMWSHIGSSLLQEESLAIYLQPLWVEKGEDIWSVEGIFRQPEWVRGLTSILSNGHWCLQFQRISLCSRTSYSCPGGGISSHLMLAPRVLHLMVPLGPVVK